jgi:hypothetical protein
MQLLAGNSLVYNKKTKEEYKIFIKEKTKNISKKRKKNKLKYLIRKRKARNLQTANQSCFFLFKGAANRTPLENNLAILLGAYSNTKQTDQLYQDYIASTPDQYKFKFYNKLLAKIQSYQLIDMDQAANFEFASNKFTKVAGTFLNLFYVLPVPILPAIIAGAGQFALKIASDKRKVNKTKNKLAHCIPGENFIKLLTILLTKFHEAEFLKQKNINSFSEKKFQEFWSVFKTQAKANPNTENLIQFWSKCLFEYFKQQETIPAFFSDDIKTLVEVYSTAQAFNKRPANTWKTKFYAINQSPLQHKAGFFKPNSDMPIEVGQSSFMSPVPGG